MPFFRLLVQVNSRHLLILLLIFSAWSSAYAQKKTPFSFDSLFTKYPDQFDSVIQHKEDYRLQLLYTRIDRDANNTPHLTTYSFDADKYYYYCASMMKLPACALTLEKLHDLSQYHVTMFDSLGIDSVTCPDLSPESMMLGTPYSCLSQYIKEMLLVSNNSAFNPVYDFLGQQAFQDRMHQIGFPSVVISNRYAGCDTDANRRCNPVYLYDRKTHQLKYSQPCAINPRRQFYQGELSPLVGNAYLGGGSVINEPKSFRFANYIKLSELHRLLTKIILPETQAASKKLRLTSTDYQYLYKCMGMFPRECAYPAFDSVHYPDNYMKYFMGIDSGSYTMPANIRIFNKVGQAYGFMTDCSYVMDTLNKVEFFLSCAMYLNADGILNDGKYEYDQIGYPFFHNLFNAVYNEELTRHKNFTAKLQLPDFSDTLLVKVKPLWLKVDTTRNIEEMEAVLCTLADSMLQNPEDMSTEWTISASELFQINMEIVLRQKQSINYSFAKLIQRRISLTRSLDGRVSIFYWLDSSNHSTRKYEQVANYKDTSVKINYDWNCTRQITRWVKIYDVSSLKDGNFYLVHSQGESFESLNAYKLDNDSFKLYSLPIFKEHPGQTDLSTGLFILKQVDKYHINYDAQKRSVTYYQFDNRAIKGTATSIRNAENKIDPRHHRQCPITKAVPQKVKLKFDGTIFK